MKNNYSNITLCLFLIIGLSGNHLASAQNRKVDSLLKVIQLQENDDKQRLKSLNELARVQGNINPNIAIKTADLSIILANKINDQKELVHAYNIKAGNLTTVNLISQADSLLKLAFRIDTSIKYNDGLAETIFQMSATIQNDTKRSLGLLNRSLELFKLSKNETGLADTYFMLGSFYRTINYDTARVYFQLALPIYTKLNDEVGYSNTMGFIGGTYLWSSQYEKAIECLNVSIPINLRIGNLTGLQNDYFHYGILYSFKGNVDKELEYFLKALRIAEIRDDKSNSAGLLINIGTLYIDMKEYDLSNSYLQKGLNLAIKTGVKSYVVNAYMNLGLLNQELGKYDISRQFYNKSITIAQEVKDESLLSGCYGGVGDLYEKMQNFSKAMEYFNKAAVLNLKNGNNINYVENLISLSRTIKNAADADLISNGIKPTQRNIKAIEYAFKALEMSKETGELQYLRNASEELSELYEKENNPIKASYYYKQFILFKDSIINTEIAGNIANMQIQYETEKKEQEIALLNKDKALQQSEIEIQKTTRNAFIGGFILFSLIGGVTYNRYRIKQKANRKLSLTLTRLKNAHQQLIEQERLASLGQLTAGIAHEIQNPLNFVINFSDLSTDLFDDIVNAKTEDDKNDIVNNLVENNKIIESHSLRAARIVKSMLMHSRNYSSEKTPENLNLICENAIENAYQNIKKIYKEFDCKILTQFDNNIISVNLVSQDFSRVLLNLLSNAFYAVYDKSRKSEYMISENNFFPEVILITELEGDRVKIKISDNGNGVPDSIKSKIFQPFFTTKPTHEGTGLGLSISYDIVKAHNGDIVVESKAEKGTTFIVSLPIT